MKQIILAGVLALAALGIVVRDVRIVPPMSLPAFPRN